MAPGRPLMINSVSCRGHRQILLATFSRPNAAFPQLMSPFQATRRRNFGLARGVGVRNRSVPAEPVSPDLCDDSHQCAVGSDRTELGGYRASRPQRPASPGAGCRADQSATRWLVTWPGAGRLPRRHAGWSGSPLLVHQVQLAAARDIVTGCWPGPAMSPRGAGLRPTGIGAAGLSRGARRMP